MIIVVIPNKSSSITEDYKNNIELYYIINDLLNEINDIKKSLTLQKKTIDELKNIVNKNSSLIQNIKDELSSV